MVTRTRTNEGLPQLVIIPTPEKNSFDLVIRYGFKNEEAEFIQTVTAIKWDMVGRVPNFNGKRERNRFKIKYNTRVGIVVPKIGRHLTKQQYVINCGRFLFKDREFTSRELFNVVEERNPQYRLSVRSVSGILLTSKFFTKRKSPENKLFIWKCKNPDDIPDQNI